jgi:hypothetical protein
MGDYNSEDWENIPQIIPTSISSISRQLRSIQSWMQTKDSEETTTSLSIKMNKQEHRLQDKMQEMINEKQSQITDLANLIKTANKEIEKLKEKPKIEEAIVQTDLTLKDLENHSDISEDENSEGEDEVYTSKAPLNEIQPPTVSPTISAESVNRLVFGRVLKKKQEENKKESDMVKPRMYSLDIFKKLLFKYLNRSKLKSKVLIQEQKIPNIETKTEQLSTKIETTVHDFQLEIKNIYEQIEFYKETLNKLCNDVEAKLKDISKWSERVEQKFTDIDLVQDDLKIKSEVMHEDYEILKQFTKRTEEKIPEIVKELKEDTRKKFESVQKNLRKETAKTVEVIEEKIENTNKSIEKLYENITKEYMSALENFSTTHENNAKELNSELSQQISDYRKFYECDMESFQKTYNENRLEIIENNKKFSQDFRKLRNEFDKWVSTVMEPAHVSEARIFTVEARVKEEEAARLDQLHFIKDVMRKLFFSLEQAQISGFLPGIRPNSRAENDPNVSLFMKRLGFLKKLVQYSVDQQKTKGTYIRKSSPYTVKDHFTRTAAEESLEGPFITEKQGKFKDSLQDI